MNTFKQNTFKLTVTIKNKIQFNIFYRQEVAFSSSYINTCLQSIDNNKNVDYYLNKLSKLVSFPIDNYLEEDKLLEGISNKEERNSIFKLIYCIKSICINTLDGTSVSS